MSNNLYFERLAKQMDNLPPATPKPCSDCPWVRDSIRGWVGPYEPEDWTEMAHRDGPIACHQTIKVTDDEGNGDWDDPKIRQCKGAAIFRANICKSPIFPKVARAEADHEKVFSWDNEFIEHHTIMKGK